MKVILFLIAGVFLASPVFAVTPEECFSFLQKKDKEKALFCGNNLVASSKDKKSAYLVQATIFSYFNEIEKSIEAYSRAINLNPKQGSIYALRAGQFLKLERYKNAISDFTQAIQFNNIQDDVYLGSLYLQRASVYQKTNSMQNAINDYKKGKSILDTVTDANWAIKNAAIPNPGGKLESGKIDLRQSLYIDINFGLCSSNIALEKLQEALPYCEKVHEMDDKSIINKMNLSACLIEVRKFDDAKRVLDSIPSHIRKGNFYVNMNYAAFYANKYFAEFKNEDKDLLNEYLQTAKKMIRGENERKIYLQVQKEIEEKAKKTKK